MIERFLRRPGALLLVLFCYSFLLWKMSVPLTGDQKVYLTIAREMRSLGDWVIPHLFGRPNFLKPPLQYWASLVGFSVFGFNLFGALIPSVLAMVGAAFLTARLGGSRSLIRAVFFSACLSTMTYGTTAQMEIWIVWFYLLAWYAWTRGAERSAWGVTGLMSIVKGPLYPALWVFSVILEKSWSGRFRELLKPRFIFGLCAGIGIGLLWYVLAATREWEEMKNVFFYRENIGKLSTHQGSPWGLWGEFLGTLFPMLPWLVHGFFTSEFREALRKNGRFWLSYGLVPALFFTFFPYRVNTYLFLLVPLAVWMMPERVSTRGRVSAGLFVFAVISTLILTGFAVRLHQGGFLSLGLTLMLTGSLGVWAIAHHRLSAAMIALSGLLFVNAIRIAGVELGERDLSGLRRIHRMDPRPLAYFMDREDIWHEGGLISVALGAEVRILTRAEEADRHLAEGGLLILTDEQEAEARGLHCAQWERLRKRMKFPVSRLLLEGLRADDPELLRTYRVCARAPS
jgi:4-amino-4-deoxy-L-arabinose transferase-like glycosyltransferase